MAILWLGFTFFTTLSGAAYNSELDTPLQTKEEWCAIEHRDPADRKLARKHCEGL